MPLLRLFRPVLAVAGAILFWEVALRLFLSGPTSWRISPLGIQAHPAGFSVNGYEGFSWTRFNGLGYRGPETAPKARGEFRILVVGDSYTEAVQIPDGATYTDVLAKRLGQKHEVINCGLSGESPADYVLHAKTYLKYFQPDQVVVELNEGDFTSDLYNMSDAEHAHLRSDRSLAAPDIKPPRGMKGLFSKLMKPFAIASALFRKVKALREAEPASEPHRTEDAAPDPRILAAIDWTVIALKNSYPRLTLVYAPSLHYAERVEETNRSREYRLRLHLDCQHESIKLLDPADRFKADYLATRQPPTGFWNTTPGLGHWNQRGHRIVGEMLAEALR